MQNDFNSVAGIYDVLVRLVFGKAMVKAQTVLLDQIPGNAKLLILGGGTGWVVEELLAIQPDVTITYIDASSAMILKAKRRLHNAQNKIRFIQGTEQAIPPEEQYDVVITNFFLDLFTDSHLQEIVKTISDRLNKGGLWIATDFVSEQAWHRVMLGIMYRFFRMTSNIEAACLPLWMKTIETSELKSVQHQRFYGRFISAVLFLKTNG